MANMQPLGAVLTVFPHLNYGNLTGVRERGSTENQNNISSSPMLKCLPSVPTQPTSEFRRLFSTDRNNSNSGEYLTRAEYDRPFYRGATSIYKNLDSNPSGRSCVSRWTASTPAPDPQPNIMPVDDDVVFVSETKVPEAEKRLATSLELPPNYFAFKYHERNLLGYVDCDQESRRA